MSQLTQDEVMDAFKEADPTHDAEDAATFWARAENGLDILRQNTRDGQNVLVVAHGTMIRNLVYKYDSHETAKEKPLNGSISVWEVSDDDMKLKAYNDTTTNW